MAIPLSVGDVIEVSFEGLLAGQQVMNLLHYRVKEGESDDFANWLNTSFGPWLEDAGHPFATWVNCLSQDVTDIAVYGQIIYPVRRRYFRYDPIFTEGQIATGSLPPNDSAVIVKQGDLAQRDNIGVMHLPGIPTDVVVDGILTVPYRALLQNLADSLSLGYDSGFGLPVLEPVLFKRTDPSTGAVITGAYPPNTSRIVRRRTVGLGT